MKNLFLLTLLIASNQLSSQNQVIDESWIPTVEFKETTYDFGTISEGPRVSHEFIFKNTGDEPVIVQNCRSSCGCVTPEWSKEPVLPGKSAVIRVNFNTEGRPGLSNKDVSVDFANQDKNKSGRIRLTIVAQVTGKFSNWIPEIEMAEANFDFGTVDEGIVITHEFIFKNTGNEPVVIRDVMIQCNCTTAKWPKNPVKPGESAAIIVSFDSDGRIGSNTKGLTIEFGNLSDKSQSGFRHIKIQANVLEKER